EGGKRGGSARLLDGHFHGFRFGGWLLLRDPHLEEAVLQGGGREVRLHLFREAEDTLKGLVGPLGVIVVLLVLLAGPLRLGPDLDSVLGHGEVDVLFGHARHLRAHDMRQVSRYTVIGMAPLLNSIHAISIGSTTPEGTSMRIGDPMLIWRARAPMIRAFSNRV